MGPRLADGQCEPERALRGLADGRLAFHPPAAAGDSGIIGRVGQDTSRSAPDLLDRPAVRAHMVCMLLAVVDLGGFPHLLPGLSLPGGKHAVPPRWPRAVGLFHDLALPHRSGDLRRRSTRRPHTSPRGPPRLRDTPESHKSLFLFGFMSRSPASSSICCSITFRSRPASVRRPLPTL